MVLSEESQSLNASMYLAYCVILLIQNVQNKYRERKEMNGFQGLREEEWGVTANMDGITLWSDENILKLIMMMVVQLHKYAKNQ